MADTEFKIKGEDLLESNVDIKEIGFAFSSLTGDTVSCAFGATPDEDVMDASESDFPQFDCILTVNQFEILLHQMMDFAEQITNYDYMRSSRR